MQAARAQARRRLIGAVVLLAIGVVLFPMLFETQPRPLAKDIPIELPKRDVAAPKAPAVPRVAPAVTELPVPEPAVPASAAVAEAATPAPVEPDKTAAAVAAAPASAAVAAPSKPVAAAASAPRVPASAPKAEPPRVDPRKAESERARAALEGRGDAPVSAAAGAASDAKAGRFVVQVGAYTDAATLREVRAKVEKLGLKTYTQSVDTEAGKRTRVRVGPFATKQEAESASSKLKGAGLPGNVLVL